GGANRRAFPSTLMARMIVDRIRLTVEAPTCASLISRSAARHLSLDGSKLIGRPRTPGRRGMRPSVSAMPTPTRDIAWVADTHRRLLEVIEAMTDGDVRRASLLPGWTVGHVLTHIARNADSHVRRTDAARRGEMADQYDGGYAG